jgi:hypothetical protein
MSKTRFTAGAGAWLRAGTAGDALQELSTPIATPIVDSPRVSLVTILSGLRISGASIPSPREETLGGY